MEIKRSWRVSKQELLDALENDAMTEHPSAEDYRNRAERAEQEAAELRATVERLEKLVEDMRNPGVVSSITPETLANDTAHMIR